MPADTSDRRVWCNANEGNCIQYVPYYENCILFTRFHNAARWLLPGSPSDRFNEAAWQRHNFHSMSATGPLLPLAGRSDAAVWLVEGDIRGNRESAALCFLLCSSLMVIDKVGL